MVNILAGHSGASVPIHVAVVFNIVLVLAQTHLQQMEDFHAKDHPLTPDPVKMTVLAIVRS